jgi:hypothetical protein
MTEESYKDFLARIVSAHLPEEAVVFELDGGAMVNAIFREEWEGHTDGHGDKYGFADLMSAKPMLEIVLIALSTFKVITELRLLKKKSKEIELAKLQHQWERRLRMEGVKPAKAKAITADFTRELVSLAKSV